MTSQVPVLDFAGGLEAALAIGGATHSLADVVEAILAGRAQLWQTDRAMIVTEIEKYPRKRVLRFWLATGDLEPVVRLSREVLAWGREQGCETATLTGRRGWVRALRGEGWSERMVVMEREIG